MKTSSITAATLSVFLLTGTTCFAAPIDFTDHGSYTTDTISALDWLDVTASVNRSYNDVSSQFGAGGDFEGWRYATGEEFIALVNHYTDGNNISYDKVDQEVDKIDGLVILLGSTLDSHTLRHEGQTFDSSKNSAEGEWWDYTKGILAKQNGQSGVWLAMIDDYDGNRSSTLDYTYAHYTSKTDSTYDYQIGSYLVRDSISAVPVPAAVYLFSSALLGLIGFRHRLSASAD